MQHLVLLSFFLLIVGLVVTAVKLPGGLSKTFSQRVANNKTAEILYALLFITVLPILYLFFTTWFVPVKHVTDLFLWFAAIAVIFQIVCTFVPERGGGMTIVHRVLTGVSGVTLLPMVYIVAITNTLTFEIRLIAWVILGLMVGLFGLALVNQKGFKYALLLQVGYYALFFAIILLATYV
ncbi:MAG: hypothetical protein WBP12_02180 [Candidatus Saccharimonas sp.]